MGEWATVTKPTTTTTKGKASRQTEDCPVLYSLVHFHSLIHTAYAHPHPFVLHAHHGSGDLQRGYAVPRPSGLCASSWDRGHSHPS